jgi:hypothetical protein
MAGYMDPYEAEQDAIKQRRAIAQALMAQSQQPLGPMPAGAVQARRSPMEGIAQLARAYAGSRGMQQADTDTRALGEQQKADAMSAYEDYKRATTPRESVAASMTEDPAGVHQQDAVPSFEPNENAKREAAMRYLSKVGDPSTAGKLLVAEALKPPTMHAYKPGDVIYKNGMPTGTTIPTPPKYHALPEGSSLVAEPGAGAPGPAGPTQLAGPTDAAAGAVGPSGAPGQGHVVFSTPAKEPEPIRALKSSLLASGVQEGSPQWQKAMSDFAAKQSTHTPATVVNTTVNTDKKYGEQFGALAAKGDIDLRDAASRAPDMAERANRVKQLVASGKIITGQGADYRLAFGKAMGLVGASDAETISNTETLAAQLARNTMDAIKSSGMGGGTGFSNADRDFLEKAVGGKITLEAATISRLADLAHKAAANSASAWNTRVKTIPRGALEGTGISTDPINVPPLHGTAAGPQVSPETQRLLDLYAPK